MWGLDPQKYADDALHSGYLRRLVGHEASMLVVLNQVAGRDFNDDGVPDVSFITKDSAHPKLEIVDGTDLETRWAFLPEIGDEVLLDFSRAHVIGFVALNPDDGLKAIILAERQGRRYVHPVILDAEGSLLWDGSGRVLLTIGDREADLTERIVVFNPQIPQVEVWGVENE